MTLIAVLDDVADQAELVRRILERKGYKVASFSEEEELIAYVAKHPVDIVILDIKLKKMTGIEVLEEIRRVRPATKAIMLTGYPTLETAREALALGAREYCVKPIDKEELEQKVAALV